MKQRMQGVIVGVLVTALLFGTGTVFANVSRTINVTYGVGIVVNGVQQNFDEDMLPFISGGRTFLPVRGVAEALGVDITWNPATSNVYLVNTPPVYVDFMPMPVPIPTPAPIPTAQPLAEAAPWFEASNRMRTNAVNMQGNLFPVVIAPNPSATGSAHASWSHHNLNNQFSTLTGTIGRIDGTGTGTRHISFVGDGRALAVFSIDGNTSPTEISVDVRGVSILRIEIEGHNGNVGAVIAFANAMLK